MAVCDRESSHRMIIEISGGESTNTIYWGDSSQEGAERRGDFDQRPKRITRSVVRAMAEESGLTADKVVIITRHSRYSSYWQTTSYPYRIVVWELVDGEWEKTRTHKGVD